MNRHLIILKDWKLDWDKVDDVDFENRSSVQDSLRLFINLKASSASFEVETWSGTFVVRAEEAAGWIQG